MNISAAISSMFIIAGCFLPWIQMGGLITNKGINNPDGMIVLAAAIISFIFSIASKKKNAVIHLLVAIVCGITATVDYKDIVQRVESSEFSFGVITVGYGIYLVLIGSVLLFITGIINVMSPSKRNDFPESTTEIEIISPRNIKEKTPEEIENENYRADLVQLHHLIQIEIGKLSGAAYTPDVKTLILKSAQTRREWGHLVYSYKVLFEKDLINDLKRLTGSHEILEYYSNS